MPLFQGRMIVAGGAGLPIAEAASEHVLSLPIGPAMTDAQVAAVTAAVRGFFGA
jgi:dTDP-4-amino-4,6-dideoxygalactose transaminase